MHRFNFCSGRFLLKSINSFVSLSLCLSLVGVSACGSSEDEDRKALEREKLNSDEADAQEKAEKEAQEREKQSAGSRNGGVTGTNGSSDLLGRTGGDSYSNPCEVVLQLGTLASASGGGRTALLGTLDSTCGEKTNVTLSVSSAVPLRFLIPLNCKVRDRETGSLVCTGNAKQVLRDGQISVPVDVGGDPAVATIAASIVFE